MWIHCIFQAWVPRKDFFLWSSAAWNTLQMTAAFPTPYSTWRELAERVLATSNQAPLAPRLPRCLSHLTTREPGNSFSFTENCKFTGNIWNSANSQVIAAIKSLRVANPQLFWSSHFKPHLMISVDEITWRWYTATWTKAKFEVKSLKRIQKDSGDVFLLAHLQRHLKEVTESHRKYQSLLPSVLPKTHTER